MKKLIYSILTLCLCLSLMAAITGCGETGTTQTTAPTQEATQDGTQEATQESTSDVDFEVDFDDL